MRRSQLLSLRAKGAPLLHTGFNSSSSLSSSSSSSSSSSLSSSSSSFSSSSASSSHSPPFSSIKKRTNDELSSSSSSATPSSSKNAFRPPSTAFRVPFSGSNSSLPFSSSSSSSSSANSNHPSKACSYFSVMYCKKSTKKHKSYMDGFLTLNGSSATLLDSENKMISKRVMGNKAIAPETHLDFGVYEMEVQDSIDEKQFMSGRMFLPSNTNTNADSSSSTSSAAKSHFKSLQTSKSSSSKSSVDDKYKCLGKIAHDPDAPDALILNSEQVKKNDAGEYTSQLPVVVDPYVSRHLRDHQKKGVKFLYDCVMGIHNVLYQGCILADEPGLGKTLQTISLIWTLIKSGPQGKPVLSKAIVVCPSTLVNNWSDEFRKWLGSHRLQPILVSSSSNTDDQKSSVNQFLKSPLSPVIIIGYELFRKHIGLLKNVENALVVCDEGHRLKNASGNKTVEALNSIRTRKRIILSGTPVQNDLSEFYSLCDFVNPNYLGSMPTFRNTFDVPISRSRDSSCSQDEKQLGEARSQELSKLTSSFILRRTSDILKQYLPPRVEQVLFCKMHPLQSNLYRDTVKSKIVAKMVSSGQAGCVLSCIITLKKISNHPSLIYEASKLSVDKEEETELSQCIQHFPSDYDPKALNLQHSGKMQVLDYLLKKFHELKCKAVVVSNYVETLDLIQQLCVGRKYSTLRLDGATPNIQRQSQVDRFNAAYNKDFTVFLLSSKAGGVGLNLIGGNRMILFDPDWNPSVDLQAMGRIWRDGQKSTVYIYRLMSTGSIDEKILQRQMRKQEISASVIDEKEVVRHFSKDNLKELFVVPREDAVCETYDLIKNSAKLNSSDNWQYFTSDSLSKLEDTALQQAPSDVVSFCFVHSSTDALPSVPLHNANETETDSKEASTESDTKESKDDQIKEKESVKEKENDQDESETESVVQRKSDVDALDLGGGEEEGEALLFS